MLPSRRSLTAAMLLLWAGPSASWSAPAASAALRAGETRPAVAARAAGLTMALNLPQLGQRPGRGLIPGFLQPMPESIAEGDTRIDYQMERIHLTKRRVSGGIVVEAPPEAVWACLTAYEQLPEIVPNILSNEVTRHDDGRVSIEQVQLISRRMKLETEMTLDAQADAARWELTLSRIAGHGFLEFEGVYTLQPRADGTTYLRYVVELVPCPLFPLPLVEDKIRREVPRMLVSVRDAARRRALVG